jgi:DNA primase
LAVTIPESVIAEVRERSDIVEIVGQYVSLKRSGANYLGLCPFHDEKTPSFVVSPQRHTYYCFGCHEKGDAIEFVRKMEGKGFIDAVEDLASRAGIEIPRVQLSERESRRIQKRKDDRQKALRINELAALFFQKALSSPQGKPARDYLESRGVSEEIARQFRLGYAPPGWESLTSHLARKGVPARLAERIGIVKQSRHAGRSSEQQARSARVSSKSHHDFFRNRLMFPVLGPSGEVLGFSGRLLDPEATQRKYVNSPESPVFHKAESLYGIHAARKRMRKIGRAVVVEGNLDVVLLHQAGLDEAVAPLGTALTDSQAHTLRRFCDEVVLLFDGDDAGRRAAKKAASLLLREGRAGRVGVLPEGEDPDSFVRKRGVDELREILDGAQPLADHLINVASRRAGGEIPSRVRALEEVAPVLKSIANPVTRALYVEQAADLLGIEREMVVDAMQKPRRSDRRPLSKERKPDGSKRPRDSASRHAISLLALLVAHPHLAPAAGEADAVSYVSDPALRAAMSKALDMQEAGGHVDVSELLADLDGETADDVAEAVLSEEFGGQIDGHRALKEILTALKLAQVNRELNRLATEIRKATTQGDEGRLRELALKRHQLSAKRNDLIGERV